MAFGILVSQPGIEPVAPEVEAQSPSHWTTREFVPSYKMASELLALAHHPVTKKLLTTVHYLFTVLFIKILSVKDN